MEMQEVFKITAKALPMYEGIGLTPYQLAVYMFPEMFLAVNDRYMATLVEVMVAMGYKRVLVMTGVAQN